MNTYQQERPATTQTLDAAHQATPGVQVLRETAKAQFVRTSMCLTCGTPTQTGHDGVWLHSEPWHGQRPMRVLRYLAAPIPRPRPAR